MGNEGQDTETIGRRVNLNYVRLRSEFCFCYESEFHKVQVYNVVLSLS